MKQIKTWPLLTALLCSVFLGVQAKKVHTLGDSTMAPYSESQTNTRGWGMYFGNFLTNDWTSVNYAKGGRDSRGGYNELWQNAKNSVEAGDYVLIQFAHNDEKYNGVDNLELQAYYTNKGDETNAKAVKDDGRGTMPTTTYKQCLKQIIDEVKAKGATPILVSAVCRCYFGSDNKITKAGQHNLANKYDAIVNGELLTNQSLTTDDHSMDYSYQMQQLATEENVAFIDMTAATKELYESYGNYSKCYTTLFDKGGETDNTHYNTTGALLAARLCAQLMKAQGILASDIVIPSDLSVSPAVAEMGDAYIGQSVTKELTLNGFGLEPETGTVSVSATDGILLSTDKQTWESALSFDYQSSTLVKTFYARVSLTVAGAFTGMITATLGSQTVEVPVTANGVELVGGVPFTVTWPLTGDDSPVVEGVAEAGDATIEGLVKHSNNSESGLLTSTGENGAWTKAEDDSPNQYVEFAVTAPEGTNLDINKINLKVGGRGGNALHCHVYYSTDNFVTRTTLYDSGAMTNKVLNEVDAQPVVKLLEGQALQVRVYPWYTGDVTGKWLCIRDVAIGGQTTNADAPSAITERPTSSTASTAVDTVWYRADGKSLSTPQRGVNIARQQMADGSVKTYKIVK